MLSVSEGDMSVVPTHAWLEEDSLLAGGRWPPWLSEGP